MASRLTVHLTQAPLQVHSEGDQGYTIKEPPLCRWGDHASEWGAWVRSTRGQFKSTRGSRRGHRSAPLSRLGRRGAHECTRIFPSSTPWARVETTRVWDRCMGHLAPLVERQARCTSAHTPPLGARDQTTRVWDRCMGHLAPLDERQAQRPCVCMST